MCHGDVVTATATTGTARYRVRSVLPGLAVVGAGLAVGIGTQVMQGVLSGSWSVLANSGVMWALAAFALGAVLPTTRWAMVGGAAHLVIASFAYYEAVEWFEGSSSDLSRSLIWALAGVIAGVVFGLAGHLCVRRSAWRGPSLALVGGVLVGEGMHLSRMVGDAALRTAGAAELMVAAVFGVAAFVAAARHSPSDARSRVVTTTAVALAASAWLTVGVSRLIGVALAAG